MSHFYSQSQNLVSTMHTGIDPRTGAFSLRIPIALVNSNQGKGPIMNLTLHHQTRNTQQHGLGLGFSFSFTTYDQENKILKLATGEQYQMEDQDVFFEVKQSKQTSFVFERLTDCYKITYETGRIEILDSPASDKKIKNTLRIENQQGYFVVLKWALNKANYLVEIADEQTKLVQIDYVDVLHPIIILLPDTVEEDKFELTLVNDYLVAMKQETTEGMWFFDYTTAGLLQHIEHPTGVIETIEYQSEYLRFPQDVYTALPVATHHIITSKRNQLRSVSSFTYTKNNFLGFSSGVDFQCNRDNLYEVLKAYRYGSVETQILEHGVIETQRLYNNYHLLVSEIISFHSLNGLTSIQTELEYYDLVGLPFAQQMNEFQMLKRKTITWKDNQKEVKQEISHFEFDSQGNLLFEILPKGIAIA
ncbi:type IV secretion protein Rhs [Myroides odoratus]|uniref:type IV secretion protein Rhs n=1 Tax=Myroides odoratus TaxID=256 RepID=UPI003342DA33